MVDNSNRKIYWREINRKIFHILGGLILCSLVYFEILKIWMVITILGIGIVLSVVYLFYDIPIIDFFLKRFEREHLRKTFPGKGVIYIGLGLLLIMILFEKNIVIAGLLIWTFGDSVSEIVGKNFGRIKHPLNNVRLIEGTIAGIIVATVTASFFVYWLYALIGATVSLAIESLELKIYKHPFDDNFFVPVIGAFLIYLCMMIF